MSGFDFNQIGNMAQGFMNSQGGGNNQGRNDNAGQQGGFGGGYGGDDNQQQQQQHQQGGGGGGGGFDFGQLASMAQGHSQGNHDSGLFSQAASFLQSQGGNQNVDEQKLMQDHNDVVNNPGSNSSGQIGNAAVLSALSSVFGGGGGGGAGGMFGGGGGGGGGFQQKLVSAAMSHAADLFDQKDSQGQAQGNKQDAVNHAAQMAMGLAMKNPSALAGLVGGGNSGGLGMLANMLK